MPTERRPYSRVLLKLSGEAFCAADGFGVHTRELQSLAKEIKAARQTGAAIAVVVGGGNIIRGAELARDGLIEQATADYMGMLGTVINGLALKEALERIDQQARCMTAIDVPAVAEPFIRGRALRHLDRGRIVILVAGIGNPFFTTDTCAALRATELDMEVVLKATKVDGVYTDDPKKNPNATRYETLSFAEALAKRLAVMDLTALTMCQEQGLPVVVFNYKVSGAIARVIRGEPVGTVLRVADP